MCVTGPILVGKIKHYEVKVKVTQSCLTLCEPMDYTVLGILQARILEWIFPTQGSNPGLPHCGQILYQLTHKGSPIVCSLSLLQGIFPTQESNQGLLCCRWILYQLSYQRSSNTIKLNTNVLWFLHLISHGVGIQTYKIQLFLTSHFGPSLGSNIPRGKELMALRDTAPSK